MKKYFLVIIVLLATTHLFAQEVSNKNLPKYGPRYSVNFEAPHTLVIDTFSIGMLNWFGNFLQKDTNYYLGVGILTCFKEVKNSIGVERAKEIIDYLYHKYGIKRTRLLIGCSSIAFSKLGCNYSYIGLNFLDKEWLNKKMISKDSLFQTIYFGFKSLLIDSSNMAHLDSLGTMIVKNNPYITDTASFHKPYDIYLTIHSCFDEMNGFVDVERAKMIVEYLYDKYNIRRENFILRWVDSYTKDCHHPTIDIVFYGNDDKDN